jgi:hypothetical protein
METENQKEFRRLLVSEMSRDELEDRLVEYHGRIDDLKTEIEAYTNDKEDKVMSWDEIIGGISEMLEKELKEQYGIPQEEFFHHIITYIEEKHPKYITRNKIDWEELDKTAMEHYGFESPIQWRATYQGILMEWLKKQPEFN